MPIQKEHKEFHAVDMESTGWHTPPGYPAGIEQKILAGELDEINKVGSRTRLLRFQPGASTTIPFVHEYWEEVFLISGDLIVGDETSATPASRFSENTYACRPSGVPHGPFRSRQGCVLIEFHGFDDSAR